MELAITRGSTYKVPFAITNSKGEPITAADVESVEITLANITKKYPDSQDITFDEARKVFVLFLTQQDTLSISNTRETPYMVRVKKNEFDVKGSGIARLKLKPTLSEEIL